MINWSPSVELAAIVYVLSLLLVLGLRGLFNLLQWREMRYLLWSFCPILVVASQFELGSWSVFQVNHQAIDLPIKQALHTIKRGTPAFYIWSIWSLGLIFHVSILIQQYRTISRSIDLSKNITRWQQDGQRIAYSILLKTPAVFGFIKPIILLPFNPKNAIKESLDDEQIALILKHERQHIKHGDMIWNLLALTFKCVFWFVPLQSYWLRLFKQDQELMCDYAVLKQISSKEKTRYAQLILNYATGAPQLATAVHWHAYPLIKERLNMINNNSKPAWLAGLILSAAVVTGAAVAGIQASEVVPIKTVAPQYPRAALVEGISGWVKVQGQLDSHGKVVDVEVIDAKPKGVFDEEAIKAVKKWQFNAKNQSFNYIIDFNVE
jgi:bla regulator protein blaR1